MNYCRLCANFLKLFSGLEKVIFVTTETTKLLFLSQPTTSSDIFVT